MSRNGLMATLQDWLTTRVQCIWSKAANSCGHFFPEYCKTSKGASSKGMVVYCTSRFVLGPEEHAD
eukprot:5011844-Ditylum_brightwellii.AAC.1